MQKAATNFLRFAITLKALGALAFYLIALPRVIGMIDGGGYDPILLGLYLPAIPFFVALYQAFKLLGYVDKDQNLSELSSQALKKIRYCALSISGLFALGMPYIFYIAQQDDAPGVVAIGLIIIYASFVIAAFTHILEKLARGTGK